MSEQISTGVAARATGPSCVLEVVFVELSELGEAAFESALGAAEALLRATPGYRGHQAGRCLEEPGRALLMIWWDSLEDHTVRFRGSPAYLEWRRLIDPQIRPGPLVRHFQLGVPIDPRSVETAVGGHEVPR